MTNKFPGRLSVLAVVLLVLGALAGCSVSGRTTTPAPATAQSAGNVPARPIASPLADPQASRAAALPSVTTGRALDVTDTTATLRGTFDNMGDAQAVNISFQWGTSAGSYANETPPATMGTTAPFQVTIKGLTPGTTYYFRAKAVGAGTAYGSEMSFTAGQPGLSSSTPSVSTGTALSVTGDGAILAGSIDSMGNLTSMDVNFQWGTTQGSYSNQTTAATMGTTGAFQVSLSGLKSGTTYYFRARGTNSTTIIFGTEQSFTTK